MLFLRAFVYSKGILSDPTTFMVPYLVSLDHGINPCRPLLSFSLVVLVELKIDSITFQVSCISFCELSIVRVYVVEIDLVYIYSSTWM